MPQTCPPKFTCFLQNDILRYDDDDVDYYRNLYINKDPLKKLAWGCLVLKRPFITKTITSKVV